MNDGTSVPGIPPRRRALRGQDLVTLPVLRALLMERSVTRAGEAVGLSQPAASAALARLRRRFGDELLVRVGRAYELTPLATVLLARIERATESLDQIFGATFDPATTTRKFSLALSDYTIGILFEHVNRILRTEAPGAGLDLQHLVSGREVDFDTLIRQSDGLIVPHELLDGYPAQQLLADRWVCVVSQDNPDVGDHLTLEDLAEIPWVGQLSRFNPASAIPPLRQVRSLGVDPHIDVVTDSFLAVPFLVAGSNRVAFLHERLARKFAPLADVRTVHSPVDVAVRLSLRWHPTLSDDPGHIWLRDVLARAAASMALADEPTTAHGPGEHPLGE